jgi:hypothetical protein
MSLKIVEVEEKGENLFITLEGGSVEEVTSAIARKFAYDARGKYGFSNAGIEAIGGPYPVDKTKKDPEDQNKERMGKPLAREEMAEISGRKGDLAYRHAFKLTRGI